MTKTEAMAAVVLAACTGSSLHGQVPQPVPEEQSQKAAPLAFETVSVKPAQLGTLPLVPAFMRDKGAPILGLQTLAAPVWMTIAYAYHMQRSEAIAAIRKQPDWVRNRVYTETFRVEGEPTRDQVREMMRTMLADRFGLQIHEFYRSGIVNKLVMSKPGVLGPKIKLHPAGATCSTQDASSVGKPPDASTPSVAQCGFSWYYLPGGVFHLGLTDTTISDAARSLAGLGFDALDGRPLIDATGLTGKYDLTLEFRPDSYPLIDAEADNGEAPTLLQALNQQLGVRVEDGPGPVRMVIIDHLSEPTPD